MPFRKFDGFRDVPLELSIDIGRRLLEFNLGSAERTQVVVDRNRPTAEQQVQPQDRCKRSMNRRVVGRSVKTLAEQRHGLIVVEVIGEIERTGPKCCAPILGPGWIGQGAEDQGESESSSPHEVTIK